jgi:hypothetical protein
MKPTYVASLKIQDGAESSLSQVLSACFSTSEKTYSFLRWPHRVSGIQVGIPADPVCPEGQVFSQQGELRWKSTPHGWDLLYLGIQAPPDSFIPLPGEWRWEDHAADLYGSQNRETRFPKPLSHPQDLKVGQRYFRDERTARVHFIALIPR